MKIWLRFLFIGIAILLSLFLVSYVFLASFGKTLLLRQLEELTHKKVSLDTFILTPPLRIEIKNLKIEGFLKADSILIDPSMIRLCVGQLALNNVIVNKPDLFFERKPEDNQSKSSSAQEKAVQVVATKNTGAPLKVVFVRLEVKDGKIIFVDKAVSKDGLKLVVKNINVNMSNLYSFSSGKITSFNLKGNIPWSVGQEAGTIEAEGWLNFSKKDMLTNVKIHGIDGIYLYPYYSYWVDLEKARIDKATLNFDSNIHGIDNNVTAECHLELVNIMRKPRTADEPEQKAERITNAVLDIFKAMNQGKIVLDFKVETKMNKPQFSFGNIKMAFESKLSQGRGGIEPKDIVMLPGKLLEGAVKGGADMSKSVIEGIFAFGNAIKKAALDAFIKPPKAKK